MKFLKSLIKRTCFVLDLDYAKDRSPLSDSFAILRTSSRTKCFTSYVSIPLCNFSTGYGSEHIVFVLSFNSKYNGSIFRVPIVPIEQSLKCL